LNTNPTVRIRQENVMKQETVVSSGEARKEQIGGRWMGVLMVLMGAIFLLGTSGFTIGGHSPSLLIALVPIYWIGVSAYRRYQADGRLSGRVLSIAVFAVLPFAFLAAMVLGYSVSGLWPLGAIVAGVSFILLGGRK
jgi:hypothetical protein